MTTETQLEKLKKQKLKIQKKEKLLKEKKQNRIFKAHEKIGRLLRKAGVKLIDENSLLGAFLELAKLEKEQSNIDNWNQLAKEYHENNEKKGPPLTIKFSEHPKKEIRDLLKELGFKWNSFRGEFYGYGSDKEIQNRLKNQNAKIEAI